MDAVMGRTADRGRGRHRRRRVALAALAIVAPVLAACGDDDDNGGSADAASTTTASGGATTTAGSGGDDGWEAVVAAAEEEGQVIIYGGKTEDQVANLIEAFEAAYPGIDAQYLRVRVQELSVRVEQELSQGNLTTDVVFTTATDWLAELATASELAPIEGPGAERWPADLYADDIARVTTDAIVLEYNTDLVDSPPTTLDELVDLPFGLKDNTAPLIAGMYEYFEESHPGILETWAAANPRIYDQTEPAILSGEIAWAPWGQVSSVELQKAQGAPVDWAIPETGTVAIPQSAAALVDGPNPNAGRVFLDFMMSEAGQRAINGDLLGISLVDDFDGELQVDIDLLEFIDLSRYDEAKLNEFAGEFDRLFR